MAYPYVNKSNYDFMQKMVKMFKIGDNAKTGRRAASIVSSSIDEVAELKELLK